MKKTLCLTTAFFLLGSAASQASAEEQLDSSGGFTIGVQQLEINRNSAKFNEYRDIRDGFYIYDFWFDLLDGQDFMMFNGSNLLRDDQSINFRFGEFGRWSFEVDRNEIPHRLSNRAQTPFIHQGGGLFTVPTPVLDAPIVGIPNAAGNTADMLANDQATADWLATHLRHTNLGTQRNKTAGILQLSPLEGFNFRLSYSDERKEGSKITAGPIGNRPPNTMNVQLAEPIDYATRELKFEAEYNQPIYQALFTYLYSDFENDIDTLRWQNIWAFDPENPLGFTQATSAGGTHLLGTFGQRALAPDNTYHNASLSVGINLPMASRLAATAAYGVMKQDEKLLPYSTTDFGSPVTAFGSTAILPRQDADAEIKTKLLNADYTINPMDRLNLRAFVRYYDLDNDTPQDNWHYVTSDALPAGQATSGVPTHKNQRSSLAYAYDQLNLGADVSYSMAFWRTTLGLGFEREEVNRDFREADTDENIYKVSVRTRPIDWMTLRAKYLRGDREGSAYNNTVTSQSYWYEVAPATDFDNPKFAFTNHPDMRKFDVIDRERNQFDIAAGIMPMAGVDLTASYFYQKDDFDAGVRPTQPLLGNELAVEADRERETPGDQLGLLERKTQRYAIDASYAPTDRLILTAFGSRETMKANQRGLEFNENNKLNPSTVDGAELGPWDRQNSQWIAETDDRTNTFGISAGFEIIPGRLRLFSDYTISRGKVDIEYSGFGDVSSLDPNVTLPDNHQFAFRTPETVRHNQYILNASLEYQLVTNLVFGLHYIFDRYKTSDWMDEASGFWVEQVDSEFSLRDTSQSHQWGNRLVTLASPLAPSYEAHVGSVTMTYRF
jgi:MtrB/PioB family decaheme-associated outer membrane protein